MLTHVTLHLARSKQFPDGSSHHGYEITAPLDEGGHLDQREWSVKRDYCRVQRFWKGEAQRNGVLVHRAGGAGGGTWMIDYDQDHVGDEEAGFHLHDHRFRQGDYITIRDKDDELHTFRVVSGHGTASSHDGKAR